MTTAIITVFVIGYLFIALESLTKVNKAAVALIMGIICWTLLIMGADVYGTDLINSLSNLTDAGKQALLGDVENWVSGDLFHEYLAEVCETVLFLLGAMTVVETVDSHGGFHFVKKALYTPNPKALLWKVSFMTFFLSAVLDNMTTAIVMTMVLKNLIDDHGMRMKFAGIVIIAANAGGAFSPIGDVTTIMLWIGKFVSTTGIITGIFIPSMLCLIVPTLLISFSLKGSINAPTAGDEAGEKKALFSPAMQNVILVLGVGGLMSVPAFHTLTGLPPFMGILTVLSVLWIATEVIIYLHHNDDPAYEAARVSSIIRKIDMPSVLFFLGILVAVDAVAATGSLAALGTWLDANVGNIFLVDSIIGVFSSVVDNVPLVASAMNMYPIADAAQVAADPALAPYVQDGLFWELLAFCAGTGGSLLIIGSAAGVVVMGLEKISFIWYLKNFTLLAFSGYLAGIIWYWFEKTVLVGIFG